MLIKDKKEYNFIIDINEKITKIKNKIKDVSFESFCENSDLQEIMWQRREIENYLPILSVVERYLEKQGGDLSLIRELMSDYMPPIAKKDKRESWWFDTKMSDDFLDKIFRQYFQRLKQPVSLMSKSNYYELALLSEPNELDGEVLEKLDALFLMFRE